MTLSSSGLSCRCCGTSSGLEVLTGVASSSFSTLSTSEALLHVLHTGASIGLVNLPLDGVFDK